MKIGRSIAVSGLILAVTLPAAAQETMYGSTGSGTNQGAVGIVNQTNGSFSLLGDPTTGDLNLVGLSFDSTGRLWGVEASRASGSTLIEINPNNGSLISTVGPIQDSSMTDVKIIDLATQPGTDTLFGIDDQNPGQLWKIDKETAVATLVGSTGISRGGLAFAPDGTLYLATRTDALVTLDPATGLPIGTPLDTGTCFDGLAVRPSDGALFGTVCEGDLRIRRIDATTGNATLVGTPDDDVVDLAFQVAVRGVGTPASAPALAPAVMVMLAAGLAAVGVARLARRRSRREP